MRLTRQNTTQAEKITLPLYPAIYALAGLAFIFQAPERTSGGAFAIARFLMPMQAWGACFLLIGCVEVIALAVHQSRWLYIRALIAGSGLATFWTVLLFAAAVRSDDVSYTAGLWVVVAAVGQIASARMLANRAPA